MWEQHFGEMTQLRIGQKVVEIRMVRSSGMMELVIVGLGITWIRGWLIMGWRIVVRMLGNLRRHIGWGWVMVGWWMIDERWWGMWVRRIGRRWG